MDIPLRPKGDPGKMQTAAAAWGALADDLDSLNRSLTEAVQMATAGWDGAASKAFIDVVTQMQSDIAGGVRSLRTCDTQITSAAGKIADAQNKFDDTVKKMAVGAAIGVGLFFLTAGLGDVVDAAVESDLAWSLYELVAGLSAALGVETFALVDAAYSLVAWGAQFARFYVLGVATDVSSSVITGAPISSPLNDAIGPAFLANPKLGAIFGIPWTILNDVLRFTSIQSANPEQMNGRIGLPGDVPLYSTPENACYTYGPPGTDQDSLDPTAPVERLKVADQLAGLATDPHPLETIQQLRNTSTDPNLLGAIDQWLQGWNGTGEPTAKDLAPLLHPDPVISAEPTHGFFTELQVLGNEIRDGMSRPAQPATPPATAGGGG